MNNNIDSNLCESMKQGSPSCLLNNILLHFEWHKATEDNKRLFKTPYLMGLPMKQGGKFIPIAVNFCPICGVNIQGIKLEVKPERSK